MSLGACVDGSERVTDSVCLYRKQRVAQVEISKKEKLKKRLSNIKGGRHAAADARKEAEKEKTKGRKGPRAGFEGKKGEGFLNADDKKSKKKQ